MSVRKAGIQQAAGDAGQVIHRKVDALRIAPGNADIARLLGTAAKHDCVIAGFQLVGADGVTDVGVKDKLDALVLQNPDPAVNDPFFQLHIGDAVHQQPAGAILPLVNRDLVTALVEQVGNRKSRGTCADDCHRLAGACRGRHRVDGTTLIAVFHDGTLVLLDGHRVAGHMTAGAGGLAQGGADPAGKLGVAVCGNQAVYRQVPLALIDQIVPLGDEVIQRAAAEHPAQLHAALAKGYAAIHAACALGLLLVGVQRDVKLVKIANAFLGRQLQAGLPRNLDKSCRFSHGRLPPLLCVLHGVKCFHLRLFAVLALFFHLGDKPQHLVVIVRKHLLELGQILAEIVKNLLAARRASQLDVFTDQVF